MCPRNRSGELYLTICSGGPPVLDVVGHCSREEKRLLQGNGHGLSQALEIDLAYVLPVYLHLTLPWIVEEGDQGGQSALTGTGGPHDSYEPARLYIQRKLFEHGALGLVAEGDVAKT